MTRATEKGSAHRSPSRHTMRPGLRSSEAPWLRRLEEEEPGKTERKGGHRTRVLGLAVNRTERMPEVAGGACGNPTASPSAPRADPQGQPPAPEGRPQPLQWHVAPTAQASASPSLVLGLLGPCPRT